MRASSIISIKTLNDNERDMLKELCECAYDYSKESEQSGDWTKEQFNTYNDIREVLDLERLEPYK